MRKAGYDCSTVVIVMNTKDYQNVELLHAEENNYGFFESLAIFN